MIAIQPPANQRVYVPQELTPEAALVSWGFVLALFVLLLAACFCWESWRQWRRSKGRSRP